MSVFGKLFGAGGGKAGKGGPTPQDAIQRLRDTEEMLSKKQEFLETKIEQELTAAKKHGTKNKRGESAQSPQTLLRLPSGSQGPDSTSVRHTPGSAPTLALSPVRLPSRPLWTPPRLAFLSIFRGLGLLHHQTHSCLLPCALPTLPGPFRPWFHCFPLSSP